MILHSESDNRGGGRMSTTSEQKQTLAEAAEEIQKLLQQLEQANRVQASLIRQQQ